MRFEFHLDKDMGISMIVESGGATKLDGKYCIRDETKSGIFRVNVPDIPTATLVEYKVFARIIARVADKLVSFAFHLESGKDWSQRVHGVVVEKMHTVDVPQCFREYASVVVFDAIHGAVRMLKRRKNLRIV